MGPSLPEPPKRPRSGRRQIVVVSAPFSYGDHLAAMLGQNPTAYAVPETNLALSDTLDMHLRELVGLRGSQMHGLIRALSHLLSGEQTIASGGMAWRWIFARLSWPTSWVRDFLTGTIAPMRMVEKNTSVLFDSLAADRLMRQCVDADFVHVTRHPFHQGLATMQDGEATAAILGSYDDSGETEVLDPQYLWVRAERAADGLLKDLDKDRVHRLRSEDLWSNTRASLQGLCERLGLATHYESIDAMLRPEQCPFSGPGPAGMQLGAEVPFLRSPHVPAPDPPAGLDAQLPWRSDGKGFHPDTIALARRRGYA